ncbi:MAG TPA: hypothetical protein VIL01_00790 [Thermomicrobiales bacterium]
MSSSTIQLSDDDVQHLLTLLRNANQPMTTQQLITALRARGQQTRSGESGNDEGA